MKQDNVKAMHLNFVLKVRNGIILGVCLNLIFTVLMSLIADYSFNKLLSHFFFEILIVSLIVIILTALSSKVSWRKYTAIYIYMYLFSVLMYDYSNYIDANELQFMILFGISKLALIIDFFLLRDTEMLFLRFVIDLTIVFFNYYIVMYVITQKGSV